MAQLSSHGGNSNNNSSLQEMVQVEVAVEVEVAVAVEVVVALEVVPQVHIAHVQALGVLLLPPPLHSAVLGAHWMKAQHQTKAFSDCCS